jgi:hypothetical protein
MLVNVVRQGDLEIFKIQNIGTDENRVNSMVIITVIQVIC